MSQLSISNVINISVSTPPVGIAAYQVNNLVIFTKETPVNGDITKADPGVYLSITDVLADWGSDSEVYAQAVAIFSQSPNILDGDGRLFVYPMDSGDTLDEVIVAYFGQQFFGGALVAGYDPTDEEYEDAAASAESLRVKTFVAKHTTAALADTTGLFFVLHGSSVEHCRKLLYTQGGTAEEARIMAAAYAGRAMSVNFDGNATAITMHLKQLATIQADLGITQAILETCQTLGVDVYPSIAGRASVFCSGGDDFFDNVYNLDWLVFALTVAGFNALATTGTKLPQTEPGIAVLRGAYITVLQQAVAVGFVAPGAWNSPELFGVPASLIRNVLQLGYYIYSQPVNQQSQAARAARAAPLIQIAIKYAGAVHSSSVIVYVNP